MSSTSPVELVARKKHSPESNFTSPNFSVFQHIAIILTVVFTLFMCLDSRYHRFSNSRTFHKGIAIRRWEQFAYTASHNPVLAVVWPGPISLPEFQKLSLSKFFILSQVFWGVNFCSFTVTKVFFSGVFSPHSLSR